MKPRTVVAVLVLGTISTAIAIAAAWIADTIDGFRQ